MNQIIVNISITKDATILQALKKMDEAKRKLLIVTTDNNLFFSLVSIGDLQRAIIKNISLSDPISTILREDITVAHENDDIEMVKERMKTRRNEFMPVINNNKQVVRVLFWDELFEKKPVKDNINLPVVIMAGGLGTRLKPLTNIIPKPLIPLNDKTILELIMDQFQEIGCNKFYKSVNYKFELLKYFIDNFKTNYDVVFFKEEKPLGTNGSVSLLKNKIKTPFFVSNCDIIIDQDYRDVYDYHVENSNQITIVAAVKSYKIPYGVVEAGDNGSLQSMSEKPEITYMINTGVYILNPELIDDIPENQFFHITELIEHTKNNGGKVGCFPVSEKAWTDIGDWNEYLKYINLK